MQWSSSSSGTGIRLQMCARLIGCVQEQCGLDPLSQDQKVHLSRLSGACLRPLGLLLSMFVCVCFYIYMYIYMFVCM